MALTFPLNVPSLTTFTDGTKTVASAGTPEPLVASDILVREVAIFPKRGNAGTVYIGVSATNDSQHITLPYVLTPPDQSARLNLANIYVDVATNADGVYFFYIQ